MKNHFGKTYIFNQGLLYFQQGAHHQLIHGDSGPNRKFKLETSNILNKKYSMKCSKKWTHNSQQITPGGHYSKCETKWKLDSCGLSPFPAELTIWKKNALSSRHVNVSSSFFLGWRPLWVPWKGGPTLMDSSYMDFLVQHLSNLDGSYLIDWILPTSNRNQNNWVLLIRCLGDNIFCKLDMGISIGYLANTHNNFNIWSPLPNLTTKLVF